MENKTLYPAESLDLIQNMISAAKNKLADNGFLIILWGWLVTVASLLNYFFLAYGLPDSGLIWLIMMPLGAIVTVIYSRRKNKKENVRTHVGHYLGYAWSAFIVAMFITLLAMPLHGMKVTYFFLMILYGMATLISGGLLAFRPLVIGSAFSFACAILSTFFGNNEQFLLIALALICSYIVPGHLLMNRYRSQADVQGS